ncbi:hypothetical protein NDU88_000966 [Pleurodeles waltl]|uniref:Uncharacterized protein n=1 Tax=Pleurodeles waltl TaxID=8319 RepID=A0AAV7S7H4_PLEWA|nr:hypothetical protein NDU88_000966 [Pleurodeles waltl]
MERLSFEEDPDTATPPKKPHKGAWPRWRRWRTRWSVLCRLGLRHRFPTPVGELLGCPVIAPGPRTAGSPGRLRQSRAEERGRVAGAGSCSRRARLAVVRDARRGLGPGGRTPVRGGAAGVRRGSRCGPDVALSTGALRAAEAWAP